jgi:hypothetical protein
MVKKNPTLATQENPHLMLGITRIHRRFGSLLASLMAHSEPGLRSCANAATGFAFLLVTPFALQSLPPCPTGTTTDRHHRHTRPHPSS